MAEIVLRVRLTNGGHVNVKYEDPDTAEVNEVVEQVISTLAEDTGVLRTRHGDRLMAAPRGAVLDTKSGGRCDHTRLLVPGRTATWQPSL